MNWGEDESSSSSSQWEELCPEINEIGMEASDRVQGNSDRIDEETAKMVNKVSNKKKKISEGDSKKKFEFKKEGNLHRRKRMR